MSTFEKGSVSLSQLETWNRGRYVLIPEGSTFPLVIVGEYHYRPRLQRDQLRLARKFGAQVVLHEFLRTYVYNPETDSFDRPNPEQDQDDFDPRPHLHPFLLAAARKRQFILRGCDIGQAELRDLFFDRLTTSNPKGYELVDPLGVFVTYRGRYGLRNMVPMRQTPEGIEIRDERISERLKAEVEAAAYPVIAIMGTDHARSIHERRLLANNSVAYCMMDQSSVIPAADRKSWPVLRSKGGNTYLTIP